jgi:hypothetical protein
VPRLLGADAEVAGDGSRDGPGERLQSGSDRAQVSGELVALAAAGGQASRGGPSAGVGVWIDARRDYEKVVIGMRRSIGSVVHVPVGTAEAVLRFPISHGTAPSGP